jgi:hypothetical protein
VVVENDEIPDRKSWWGVTTIPQHEQRHWCIGPLRLGVSHLAGEWRISHQSVDDPLDAGIRLGETTRPADSDPERDAFIRFADSDDTSEISLMPMLADRPVVSHPTEPFFVLPGDETRLFVSTPIWLAIRLGAQTKPFELPIVRPSDTWVGATTGGGKAAYSSRTFCRLRLEDLPFRPHRCVTVVNVCNRAQEPLHLERISVAVPHLSLYASSEGRLWTQAITLTRDADGSDVEMKIADQPPSEAATSQFLAPPREPVHGHSLRSAFNALF